MLSIIKGNTDKNCHGKAKGSILLPTLGWESDHQRDLCVYIFQTFFVTSLTHEINLKWTWLTRGAVTLEILREDLLKIQGRKSYPERKINQKPIHVDQTIETFMQLTEKGKQSWSVSFHLSPSKATIKTSQTAWGDEPVLQSPDSRDSYSVYCLLLPHHHPPQQWCILAASSPLLPQGRDTLTPTLSSKRLKNCEECLPNLLAET